MTNMVICIDVVLTLYRLSVMQIGFSYSDISTETVLREDTCLFSGSETLP